MEPPDKIPLDEAIRQGLIPCAACGARGAEVRQLAGRKHFLCFPCARRSARLKLAGLVAIIVAAVAFLAIRMVPGKAAGEKATSQDPADPDPAAIGEAEGLVAAGRFAEARARLRPLLERWPRHARPNFLMGKCLHSLNYHESAVPFLRAAAEARPEDASVSCLLGLALQRADRSAEAIAPLQRPVPDAALENLRQVVLAECHLDLERFEEALRLLGTRPPSPSTIWARSRALTYMGRPEEAAKVLAELDATAGTDPEAHLLRANGRAIAAREAGDFAGSLREIAAAIGGFAAGSPGWQRLRRAELATHLEAGDAARLEAAAAELAGAKSQDYVGAALWYRAAGRLMAGRPEEARAFAREFRDRIDPEHTPLRLERMMMRHLAGDLKAADLEAEAKVLPRGRANDLYWYLAVATGDRAWAGKGLEATPGRNFPYHALRRAAGK